MLFSIAEPRPGSRIRGEFGFGIEELEEDEDEDERQGGFIEADVSYGLRIDRQRIIRVRTRSLDAKANQRRRRVWWRVVMVLDLRAIFGGNTKGF